MVTLFIIGKVFTQTVGTYDLKLNVYQYFKNIDSIDTKIAMNQHINIFISVYESYRKQI
jgi:hypothetical protein